MSETIIDSLVIEVEAKSNRAAKEIDELASSLNRLKQASSLTKVTNNLRKLSEGLQGLSTNSKGLERIETLANSLNQLKKVEDMKNFKNVVNSLKKIPDITTQLKPQVINSFADRMNRLAEALKPLSARISTISAGFSRLPSRISSCVAATNKMGHSTKGLTGRFKDLLAFRIGSFFTGFGIGEMLSAPISEINDYVEKMNYATQVLGKYSGRAKEYASQLERTLGIDPKGFLDAQATFMTMAQGFGLAGDKAYQLSKGMTELGYDIASFKNENLAQVFQKLQSAIAGEIEPVRRWGVALDQASMQEWLAKQGIDAKVNSLNQASKALIRYNMTVETMAKNGAIYDMARTLESPANALRILQMQFIQLARAIGSVFIPILVKIIPVVQAVTNILTGMIRKLASLVGFKMPEWKEQSWGGAVAGTGDIKDNLDGAAKAAKKAKDYVMGFDELNIIKPPEAEKGTGIAGAGAGIDLDPVKVWDKSVLDGINAKTKELEERLKPILTLAVAIGGAFLAWKIGSAIFNGVKALSDAIKILGGAQLASASAAVTKLVAAGTKVQLLANAFKALPLSTKIAIGAIGLVVVAVVDLWKHSEKFRDACKNVWGDVKDAVKTAADIIWDSVQPILKAFGITADTFSELYGKYIRPIVEEIGIIFVETLGNIVTGAIMGFANSFKAVTGVVVGLFTGDWTQAVEGIQGVFEAVMPETTKAVKGAWGNMKSWFNKDVKPKLTKEYWIKVGSGIIDGFKETFRNLKALVVTQINKIIDKINSFAEFTIPALEIGGKKLWDSKKITLFTIPHIQGFAKGGFVEDGLFTMNKGEMAGKFSDGRSVVANNQQIVKGITEGVTAGITIAIGASFKEMMPLAIAGLTNIRAMIERTGEKIIYEMSREFRDLISALVERMEYIKSSIDSAKSSIDGVKSSVDSAASQICSSISSLGSVLQQQTPQYESSPSPPVASGLGIIGQILGGKRTGVSKYAKGGFLEDGLFTMSNNEIVGKFNNGKSVVANNQQIIEGISQGVYQAVVDANNGKTDRPLEVRVFLDGKQITSTVNKNNNERGRTLLGNELGYNY